MATQPSFTHVDLTGMNKVQMLDAPIVASEVDVTRVFNASPSTPLSIAGMRHSQGGHTAIAGGRMLITETFNRIDLARNAPRPKTIPVNAGATWSEIHHQICAHARAPRVHQSSAHFSVGGSLSVNCHGREVRWGPVSETVEEITVLTGTGKTVTASATTESDLFRASLGGYGACGMILSAKLKLTPNYMLFRSWDERSLSEYQAEVKTIHNKTVGNDFIPKAERLHLHHGWVNVSEDGYLEQVISYKAKEEEKPTNGNEDGSVEWASRLKYEGWGTSELMRAGWAASRMEPSFRKFVWDRLTSPAKNPNGLRYSRLDLLREDILFTSSKGDADGVDLLQEYFVPLDKLVNFIEKLKEIFPYNSEESDVMLLSCTTRYVRGESMNPAPFLSYCGGQARVSVAIDAHVKRSTDGNPTDGAGAQFRAAIQTALDLGGTYYLPYYRFATREQFEQGYPGWEAWLEVVNTFNPSRRFHNEFLKEPCGL